MYQILANYASVAASGTNVSLAALTDPNFSTRNSHWIFTEDYYMMGVAGFGATLNGLQIYDATYNAINTPQVYPVNLSLNAPSNPQVEDLRSWPVMIPQNEEIDFQGGNSDSGAAADTMSVFWIMPRGQIPGLPVPSGGIGSYGRVKAKFTVTCATTKGAWTADQTITITNLIKGGTYCLAGLYLVCTAATAFRVNFVRAPLYQGRKMQPGGLCEEAYGNVPLDKGLDWLGPMGYFDTFEYPLLALLGNTTAGSATYTGFMDLIYMGPNMLTNQPLMA